MIQQKLSSPKAYMTYFVIAILIAVFLFIRYQNTFTKVSFSYDKSVGSITLTGSKNHTVQPDPNVPVRLKKDIYTVTASGNNIAKNTYQLPVDGSKDTYSVDFEYTDAYLKELYKNEQLAIYTAILLQYPQINSDYTIHGGRLYNTGQWFGAALKYNDRHSDNRDMLHIVLKKEGTSWKIVSTPPEPILSTQKYPSVPYKTLKSINQAK